MMEHYQFSFRNCEFLSTAAEATAPFDTDVVKKELIRNFNEESGHAAMYKAALKKVGADVDTRVEFTPTTQIVLMEGNLNQLLRLFQLAEEFKRNLKRNIRFTAGISIVAVTGILLAGFTFAATEIFYSVALFSGLAIAMKPLLDHRKQAE